MTFVQHWNENKMVYFLSFFLDLGPEIKYFKLKKTKQPKNIAKNNKTGI